MSKPYTPEELHQITLRNRTHPEEFEERDDIRFCDHCGSAMDEGYCICGGNEHFCSDDCLQSVYSKEEIENLCIGDEDSESYWTTWWENREE